MQSKANARRAAKRREENNRNRQISKAKNIFKKECIRKFSGKVDSSFSSLNEEKEKFQHQFSHLKNSNWFSENYNKLNTNIVEMQSKISFGFISHFDLSEKQINENRLLEKSFSINSNTISLLSMQRLKDEKAWLSDDLIEAFVSLYVDKHTYLMPYSIATDLFVKGTWKTYNIPYENFNKMLGIVSVKIGSAPHWVCFYVNKVEGTFIFADPMINFHKDKKEKFEIYFNNWKNYCKHIKCGFDHDKWKDRSTLFWHPKQIDKYNCGVFVAYFLKSFALNNFFFEFERKDYFLNCSLLRAEMFSALRNFVENKKIN